MVGKIPALRCAEKPARSCGRRFCHRGSYLNCAVQELSPGAAISHYWAGSIQISVCQSLPDWTPQATPCGVLFCLRSDCSLVAKRLCSGSGRVAQAFSNQFTYHAAQSGGANGLLRTGIVAKGTSGGSPRPVMNTNGTFRAARACATGNELSLPSPISTKAASRS